MYFDIIVPFNFSLVKFLVPHSISLLISYSTPELAGLSESGAC